jgi:hypothetical protein
MWVLVMMVPSGRETLMRVFLELGIMLSRSVETLKKWSVATVSIIMSGEETEFVDLMYCLL